MELMLTIYIGLVIIRIRKYRNDFELILHSASSSMNKSRFLRLFFVALSMLIAILPLQAYVVYWNIRLSMPWHPFTWNGIDGKRWTQILKIQSFGQVFFDRWTPVGMGFIIFIFCGFGHDAKRSYRTALRYVGLGYCFPNLERHLDSHNSSNPRNVSSSTTLVGVPRGRAKQLFKWCKGSNKAPQEGGMSTSSGAARKSWFNFISRRTGRVEIDQSFLLRDMTNSSQTVSSSAWAGSSRRPSQDDRGLDSPAIVDGMDSSIHVRQVITQQCELTS